MLTQAYYLHRDVILDDVTKPGLINELESMMYIMLHKPHELLSDVCSEYLIKLDD